MGWLRRMVCAWLVCVLAPLLLSGCAPSVKSLITQTASLDQAPACVIQDRLEEKTAEAWQLELDALGRDLTRLKEKASATTDVSARQELADQIGRLKESRKDIEATIDHLVSVCSKEKRLIELFEKKRKSFLWREHMMHLMSQINRRYQLHANERELHKALATQLQQEYRLPRAAKTSLLEDADLQVRAVYETGMLSGDDQIEFLYGVLEDSDRKNDQDYARRLASLNGLHRHIPALVSHESYRPRMMALLTRYSVEIGADTSQHASRIKPVLSHYLARFKTLDSVVELLAGSSAEEMNSNNLLRLLEWDFQMLSADETRLPPEDPLFRKNVTVLAGLAWHPDSSVRKRVRVILATFAPLDLFRIVAARIVEGRDRFAVEDHEQWVALLPLTDPQGARCQAFDYRATRKAAMDEIFRAWPSHSLATRERIASRLLSHAPGELGDYLTALTPSVSKEGEELLMQHVRYLRRLRHDLADDTVRYEPLTVALASTARVPFVAVRKQVVSALITSEPLTLCLALAPARATCLGEQPAAAACLLDAYLAAIARLEAAQPGKPGMIPEGHVAAFPDHPYRILRHFVARPEIDLKYEIAAFLASRDPDLLVSMLASDIVERNQASAAVGHEVFALLGDLIETHHEAVSPAGRKIAAEALRCGLKESDPDLCLLCCSYLTELGSPVQDSDLPESARSARAVRQHASATMYLGEQR